MEHQQKKDKQEIALLLNEFDQVVKKATSKSAVQTSKNAITTITGKDAQFVARQQIRLLQLLK